ncbi:MAG: hypothetical protein ACEPOW_12515 [Bacteroidales bacterium]
MKTTVKLLSLLFLGATLLFSTCSSDENNKSENKKSTKTETGAKTDLEHDAMQMAQLTCEIRTIHKKMNTKPDSLKSKMQIQISDIEEQRSILRDNFNKKYGRTRKDKDKFRNAVNKALKEIGC